MKKRNKTIIFLICICFIIITLLIAGSKYLALKAFNADLISELLDEKVEVERLTLSHHSLSSEIEVLSNKNKELLALIEEGDLELGELQSNISILTEQNKANLSKYNLNDDKSDYAKAISSSFLLLDALITNNLDTINETLRAYNNLATEEEIEKVSNLIVENFDDSDEFKVSIEHSIDRRDNLINISSGNNTISIYYYTKDGSTFYLPTIIFYNSVNAQVKLFYDAIKNEDINKLRQAISERDHMPTEEEAVKIMNIYKERFDLDTLEIDLVSFDNMTYCYLLKGYKHNLEVSDIIYGEYNEVPYLLNYYGYQEWKRVDPEY